MDVSLATTAAAAGLPAAAALQARQKALTDGLKPQAGSTVSEAQKAKMQAKSQEFESFYVYQFLELMTPENKSLMNGGMGEQMFRQKLNEEVAKNITHAGGFGLAGSVYNELLQHQEAANAARGIAPVN